MNTYLICSALQTFQSKFIYVAMCILNIFHHKDCDKMLLADISKPPCPIEYIQGLIIKKNYVVIR